MRTCEDHDSISDVGLIVHLLPSLCPRVKVSPERGHPLFTFEARRLS